MVDEEIIIQFDCISSCLICSPHPTSLRSATFSAGEGFCAPQGEDIILSLQTLFAISPQQQNNQLYGRGRRLRRPEREQTLFAISSQQYNKQLFRRNGLAKTLGAQVIIDFRVAVSRESREERALGLSPLLFFFGYFLKMQKVTKIPT